jgi:uncharacterized protein YprB with RNaseH-like and TPR domain
MNFAIVDLECTGLKSDKGFLLCAGIKPLGKKGYIVGLPDVKSGPSRRQIDKYLAVQVRDEMEKYDGWITWNGLLFDLPFLDDRLMLCNEDTLERRFARGLDMMWHARMGKSRMSSSRLDWVAKALRVKDMKTTLDITLWNEAEDEAIAWRRGGKLGPAYKYVADHCLADLKVTEQVYERLKPRVVTISKR